MIPAAVTVSRQESERDSRTWSARSECGCPSTRFEPGFLREIHQARKVRCPSFPGWGRHIRLPRRRGCTPSQRWDRAENCIQQNYARVGSDEIDRLYAQAIQELDRKRAIELANQIDALIWQLVHSLTLYQRPEMWVTKNGLANAGAFGFAEIIYEDIGWAK